MAAANPSSPVRPGIAFAALIAGNAALAFGALFVRLADTGPTASAFWRMALAVPFLWWLAMRETQASAGAGAPRATLGWLPWIAGLFFAADLAAWHLGILQTRLANATLFGNSTTLFLVIYAMIATRRLPAGWQALAILLAFAGSALLMGRSFQLSADTLVGDLLCVLAGLLYTGYVLAMQRVRIAHPDAGSWRPLAQASTAAVLPLLIMALVLGETVWPGNWGPLILLALSSQLIGQGFSIYALPHFSPLIVGLSLLLQPVIAAAAGWVMFGERLTPIDLVGASAIAIALVLVRLPDRAARAAAPA